MEIMLDDNVDDVTGATVSAYQVNDITSSDKENSISKVDYIADNGSVDASLLSDGVNNLKSVLEDDDDDDDYDEEYEEYDEDDDDEDEFEDTLITSSTGFESYNSGVMEIELDKLKEELATLKKLYENIEDIMTNSKTEFQRVPNYWQGDCGETVNEDVTEFTDNYKDFEDILKNYITHLEDSITEYESANTEITTRADQNLSDQPSGEIS